MHRTSCKHLFAAQVLLDGGSDSRQNVSRDGEPQTAICASACAADSVMDEDERSLPLA